MTDTLSLDDGQSPILSLLQQAVFEDNVFRKLNAVDILISALDDEISDKKQAKAMKTYLHKEVLSNQEFMRRLHLFSRISDHPETAIAYYGQDFSTHPEFHFNKEFMERLSVINKKLNSFIGTLIKELAKGDEIEI